MKTIAIVDYGMGNIDSVGRAVEECGVRALVTAVPKDYETCHGIILPGVGAFSAGMDNLRSRGLDVVLSRQVLQEHIPVLGICLGMQLMASIGWEGGRCDGLGWFDAEVKRITPGPDALKIPHVGWNDVAQVKPSRLWQGIASGRDFYFVHSYAVSCAVPADILAVTQYGVPITAAIQRAI